MNSRGLGLKMQKVKKFRKIDSLAMYNKGWLPGLGPPKKFFFQFFITDGLKLVDSTCEHKL
jgi:hypothetical protein